MILSCHLLTGAAIASKVRPPLALSLAFLSHYLLDLIPHREYSIKNISEKRWRKAGPEFLKVFLDFSLGMLLVCILSENNPLIASAAFLATLPDGLTFLFLLFPKNRLLGKHHLFHRKIIHFAENKNISFFWRVSGQVLIASVAIYLLLQP